MGDRINVASVVESLGAQLIQRSDDRAGGAAAFAKAAALWQAIWLIDRKWPWPLWLLLAIPIGVMLG